MKKPGQKKPARKKAAPVKKAAEHLESIRLLAEVKVLQTQLRAEHRDLEAAREDARRAIEQYTEIYDFSPVGIISIDKDRRVVECNIAAADLLGRPRAFIMNRDLSLFITPAGHPAFRQFVREGLGSQTKQTVEVVMVGGQRGNLNIQMTGLPLEGAGAADRRLRIALIDLTRQNRERDEIRKLNAELSRINWGLESEIAGRQRLAARYQLLSRAAARLLETDNPQATVEDICREVMDFLQCQVFFNYLADEEGRCLHLNACAGIPKREVRKLSRIDYGVAVCGCVARDGTRIIAEDIPETLDPRTELIKSYGVRAYCCHPLRGRKGVIGTLSFGARTRSRFAPGEVEVMQSVTDLVAIAMNRIEIEQALRQSRTDYERAQGVGTMGNWRLDILRNELVWSEENYRIFGAPPGTPQTYETFLAIVHPDDRDYVDARWKAALAGEDYDIEHRIVVDGGTRWVREKAFLEFDRDGTLIAGFGITQDITERKLVEEQLAASRHLTQSIIDNTLNLVYAFDLDERFIVANKTVAELLGSTPEKLIGKKRAELMDEATAEWHEANDRKAIEAGGPIEIEECGHFKGRDITWLTIKFPLYDSRGELSGVAGLSTDISDRKAAEAVLRRDKDAFELLVQERTKELLEAQIELEKSRRLADIGVLATTVAHELRNPLAAIDVATHNIKRKAKNPEIEKHLANVRKKVDESARIINNLLFYSRLRRPQYETVRVSDILVEALESIESKKSKIVSIVRDFDAADDLIVDADPLQLREVLDNVLLNAYDAMIESGGKIRVSSAREDGHIRIKIEDTGPGIDEESLSRVFDLFYTTKAKGTGLGLSICRQILDLHKGSITIDSKVGQGTTVTVVLPQAKKKGKQ